MKPLLRFALVLAACTPLALSQAKYTSSRAADLQIGAGYTIANSDYTVNRIRGFVFYTDFDFKEHYGAEFNFHQLNDPNSAVYERTYELGGRYIRHYGGFSPYAKGLYGRGVFNFPLSEANLAYNMLVAGAGVDVSVLPRLNIRADYEYQRWLSGQGISNGLSPMLFTFGVAYHFPAGTPH